MRLRTIPTTAMSYRRATCLTVSLVLAVAALWLASTYQVGASALQTGPKLRWAPPELKNPETIRLGTGYTYTRLHTNRDYIIDLPPKKKVGATVIEGGRNIVIIGGHITVPPVPEPGAGDESEAEKAYKTRGLYIKNATGTVHVEGVLIDGSGGGVLDGFVYGYAPQAVYQLQNMRIVGLHGNDDFHADVVAGIGGIKKMRIYQLTGSSSYQGLFFAGRVPATVQRTDLFYESSDVVEESGWNRHLLWLTEETDSCNHVAVKLRRVYITPRNDFGESFWPTIDTPSECRAADSGGVATWPSLGGVAGQVELGPPPNGNFVPEGVAGLDYVSPGYRQLNKVGSPAHKAKLCSLWGSLLNTAEPRFFKRE